MENTRLQQVKEIFAEAMEKNAADRAAFIEQACKSDIALKEEVEAFLSAAERAGDFLGSPTHDSSPENADGLSEASGTKIGPYKILELIGEGGFGSVFMAEQESPVRRRVALKIIKLGMDTKQVIARFEAERQALAMMEHPNIAKVFDAGTTETGRPYFAMQLVRGIPITEYCDKNKLGAKERLELFIAVCGAVQHAHQKGIIHRDLKPSNVVVTMHDDKPVPMVIDFGIAKALRQRLTEKTLFTGFRQMIGTVAYMSPEQAEFSGLDIDTRSDIYSLGVLLYELLTGSPPFESSELLGLAYEAMQRTIREVEPARPSTRLNSLTQEKLTILARQRSSEPRQLARIIQGDLDWIVMKCLEKDRKRRYESSSALARDLARYLASEPVEATPPSTLYRLQKYVRRNRTGVVFGGAIVLLASLSMGLYIHGIKAEQRRTQEALNEAKSRRQEAEHERALAEQQQQTASAINDFLINMLASADPWGNLGGKVTVLQAIESAQKEVDKGSLKSQPLVEASIRQVIGSVFRGMGHYVNAEANLRKALSIRQHLLPPDDPRIADSLADLAILCEWNQWNVRDVEGEALMSQALAIRQKVLPPGSPQIADSLMFQSGFLAGELKYSEADALARRALNIYRKAYPSGDPRIGSAMLTMEKNMAYEGDPGRAEPLARETLKAIQKESPADNLHVADAQETLGDVLKRERKFAEAEDVYRQCLEGFRRGGGDDRGAITNLVKCLTSEGKFRQGDDLCQEVFDIDEKTWPDSYQRVGFDIALVLGILRVEKVIGELDPIIFQRDEKAFSKLLKLERQKLSPDDPYLVTVLLNTGFCESLGGRGTEAESLVRQALEIALKTPASSQRVLRNTDCEVDAVLNILGLVLKDENKLPEAESVLRQALEIRRRAQPSQHRNLSNTLNKLANVLVEEGKNTEAESLYREALSMQRKLWLPTDLTLSVTINNLGQLLLNERRFAESEPLLREALASQNEFAAKAPGTKAIAQELAQLLDQTGHAHEAVTLRREFELSNAASKPAQEIIPGIPQ